jgi:drug/metabolite transporter (DMT)-like permease
LQITGLALIITGCVIQGVYSNYLDFLGDGFFNTPVLLVVVGCIIFFITFFGCCGAIKEHHCMTLAFSVFLALILVIELGAGIASYAFRSQVFYPPVDLYLISEKSIWKNQVRQTGFLVYFELDFYCPCSLQKSISVRQT